MTLGLDVNIPAPSRRLGPLVTHLNDALIAHFRPVDYDGLFIDGEAEVYAPVSEANMNSQFNWQSPFEQMGPESKAPAIAAMIQSGAVTSLTNAIAQHFGDAAKDSDSPFRAQLESAVAGLASDATGSLLSARGRTGVTKLNSTQIFSGLPPTKISLTLVLRAWSNPVREVMAPYAKLMQWAHPRKLAEDSVLVGILAGTNGESGLINNLLPSLAPQLLYFRYGQFIFPRMVIESIETPLSSPRDRNGNFTELLLNMTIASLQALDQQDVRDAIGR